MKHISALFLLCVITCCQLRPGNKKNDLTGKWKLTSYYADIGDGKEHWQAAAGKMANTIEFKQNGEFNDAGHGNTGRFVVKDSIHINIIPKDTARSFTWTIVTLNAKNLVIRPGCIEGCGEKYEKVQ